MLTNAQVSSVIFAVIIFETLIIGFVQPAIIPETRLNSEKKLDTITKFIIEPWVQNTYFFAFETSTGNKREENGFLKKLKNGDNVLVVKGVYSYIGPDNENYQVYYSADENGYRESKLKPIVEKIEMEENTTIMSPINLGLANRILPPGLIASLTG
ncbi:uncharacterized protein LOC143912794 [Arctopsyche grandis]|uniref:uncharacterized protein LOC143912794 n=1 Tax=Arctopsyche grandis TaxID=121162 RepID=UPI00406D7057